MQHLISRLSGLLVSSYGAPTLQCFSSAPSDCLSALSSVTLFFRLRPQPPTALYLYPSTVCLYCLFPLLGCQPAFLYISIAPHPDVSLHAFPFRPSVLPSLLLSLSSLLESGVSVFDMSYLSWVRLIVITLYHF